MRYEPWMVPQVIFRNSVWNVIWRADIGAWNLEHFFSKFRGEYKRVSKRDFLDPASRLDFWSNPVILSQLAFSSLSRQLSPRFSSTLPCINYWLPALAVLKTSRKRRLRSVCQWAKKKLFLGVFLGFLNIAYFRYPAFKIELIPVCFMYFHPSRNTYVGP